MSLEFSVGYVIEFLGRPDVVDINIPREVVKLTQSINGAINISNAHLRE